MDQLNLPLHNPRDRGRLNALRNIVAAVSEELRRQAPVVQGIIDFTVNQFPPGFCVSTPLQNSIARHCTSESLSIRNF